jgi:hypothetical protein
MFLPLVAPNRLFETGTIISKMSPSQTAKTLSNTFTQDNLKMGNYVKINGDCERTYLK